MAIGDGLDEERRRILAAMAQAGSEGVAAYEAGQAEVGAVQQQALGSAAKNAALLNVNSQGAAQLAGIVAQPGNLASTYLAAGQDRYARDTARQTIANDDYMQQAAAAVPAIKADADMKIGLLRARWEEQRRREDEANAAKADQLTQGELKNYAEGQAEMQRQSDMTGADAMRQALLNERDTLNKLEVQATKAVQDSRRTPAGPTILGAQPHRMAPPDAEAVKQLEDIKRRREAIDAKVAEFTGNPATGQATAARRFTKGFGLLRGVPRGVQKRANTANAARLGSAPIDSLLPSAHEYQREAAVGAGVNPAIAAGMFPAPTPSQQLALSIANDQLRAYQQTGAKTPQEAVARARAADPATFALAAKAGLNPEQVETIRASQGYAKAKVDADEAVQGGRTFDDLKRLLNLTYTKSPQTVRLILAEYQARLPTKPLPKKK